MIFPFCSLSGLDPTVGHTVDEEGQHQDVDRTPRGRVNQSDRGQMEKVRPWCGQPWDRGQLENRTDRVFPEEKSQNSSLSFPFPFSLFFPFLLTPFVLFFPPILFPLFPIPFPIFPSSLLFPFLFSPQSPTRSSGGAGSVA